MSQQTQRRSFAVFMFLALALGAAFLIGSLLGAAEGFDDPDKGDPYVKGVMDNLTAGSGGGKDTGEEGR